MASPFAPVRIALAALLVCFAPALPTLAHAGLETPRTLVVRGKVLKADGSPLAGARIVAKGSVTTSALSDDRGRYSITAALGAPVSLKRGAFTLEVRAESDGKRLAFAAGGPALGLEVRLVAGTDRVRVRSNAAGATAAVITAYAQDGVPTAWVDADFGGAGSAGGSLDWKAVDEVAMPGLGPAGAAPSEVVKPAPRVMALPSEPHAEPRPAPHVIEKSEKSEKAEKPRRPEREKVQKAEPRETPREAAREAKPVVSWQTRDSLAAALRAAKHAADSTARVLSERLHEQLALVEQARRDSVVRVKAARHHADSLQVAAQHVTLSVRTPRPAERAPADSCECRVRGTLEVAWEERPLEENLPVTVTLEGTNESEQGLELYLGAPREFRFGPLPCGDYTLHVHTDGRLRYTIGRGDSLQALHCKGNTQVRLVLTPLKR